MARMGHHEQREPTNDEQLHEVEADQGQRGTADRGEDGRVGGLRAACASLESEWF